MDFIRGSILDVPSGIIVQQVNCLGVMGAGLAKAIRCKWPKVFDEYSYLCGRLDPKGLFGCVQFVDVGRGLTVANSFSQLGFGDSRKTGKVYTDTGVLVGNIEYITCKAEEDFGGARVYIPAGIGCGLAGGTWSVVSSRIQHLPVTVVYYEGKSGK